MALLLMLFLLPLMINAHTHTQASIGLRKHYHSKHNRHNNAIQPINLHESHSHSRHHHHTHDTPINKHKIRNNMYGSIFATYLAPIEIDGEVFDCIMDTGSTDMAVAASAQCGCNVHYNGKCDDSVQLSVQYGDGNWSGVACTDTVQFGDLSLDRYTFAGMVEQVEMLQCDTYHTQNGIVGLAYSELLGPPTNYTRPFIDVLTEYNDLPHIFSMQCCGWDERDDRWNLHHTGDNAEFSSQVNKQAYEYAHGALDIGGIKQSHFTGEIVYTPITHKLYYGIDLIDIRVGNVSVMPSYQMIDNDDVLHQQNAINNKPDPSLNKQPETIIDSGTSNISLTPDLYELLLAELKKYAPSGLSDKFWSGDDCIPHDTGYNILQQFPDIYLTFAGQHDQYDFTLLLSPCRYLARAPASECDNKITGHALSIDKTDTFEEGNILGQTLFESYYIVHDLHRSLIGFAVIDGCNSAQPCDAQIMYHIDESELKQVRRSHQVDADTNTLFDTSILDDIIDMSSVSMVCTAIIMLLCCTIGLYYAARQYHKQQQYTVINDTYEPAEIL